MLDYFVYHFRDFALIISAVLLLLKFVIYVFYRTGNDHWRFFLYYPYLNIVVTKDDRRKKIKHLQNAISLVVATLMVMEITVELLLRM